MTPWYSRIRLPLLLLSLCLCFPVSAAETGLKVYDKWGGEFSLTDQYGRSVSLSDFEGKVVLLSFGYTHCPDICPTTLFTLQRVIKAMGEAADQVQVLFVTLDPARDPPERLRGYLAYFNSDFVGLTGSSAEIGAVAQRYGTRFEKEAADEEGDYSISHTAIIYLIDPVGRIRAFFKLNAPVQRIAADAADAAALLPSE